MANQLPREFEIIIEKFVPTGEALGFLKDKPIFVYGAIPGEAVKVSPIRVSKNNTKAKLLEVVRSSPLRREAKEEHFTSCSPWQILPEDKQLYYKKELVKSIFIDKTRGLPLSNPTIIKSDLNWHYRNKMEYGFAVNEAGELSFAFNKRYSYKYQTCLNDCVLAHQTITEVASHILNELRKNKIDVFKLKNLMVRYSYAEDKCLAMLYVKEENFQPIKIEHPKLAGWQIIYSTPLTPITVTTKKLFSTGQDYLTEQIGEVALSYQYDSFFQINPPAFAKVIEYLSEKIEPTGTLLDLYAGVGTIGFALNNKFQQIISLEYDAKASQSAEYNVKSNNLSKVKVINGLAENVNLSELFKQVDYLIVDPPRSGLHQKVVLDIMEYGPKNFIYVSCNPITQAEEYNLFKEKYRVIDWRLFDFYPQTPHVESVLILERSK